MTSRRVECDRTDTVSSPAQQTAIELTPPQTVTATALQTATAPPLDLSHLRSPPTRRPQPHNPAPRPPTAPSPRQHPHRTSVLPSLEHGERHALVAPVRSAHEDHARTRDSPSHVSGSRAPGFRGESSRYTRHPTSFDTGEPERTRAGATGTESCSSDSENRLAVRFASSRGGTGSTATTGFQTRDARPGDDQ